MDNIEVCFPNRSPNQPIEVLSLASMPLNADEIRRRLLDAQMQQSIDSATLTGVANNNPVVDVMLDLLSRDGLDPDSL